MSLITSWTESFHYLKKATGVLKQKGVKRYVYLPIVINLVVFIGLFALLLDFSGGWLFDLFGADIETGWGWLDNQGWLSTIWNIIAYILSALIGIIALVLLAYIFSTVVHLIGAPFYGIMAGKVDEQYSKEVFPEESLFSVGKRSLIREFEKILYWVLRAIPLLILHAVLFFTPLFVIMPVVWFLFGAWILGMEYFDYAPDNRGITFKQNKAILKANKWTVLAFGSLMIVFTLIPLVNLVVIPVGVAAGTMLWFDKLYPRYIAQHGEIKKS